MNNFIPHEPLIRATIGYLTSPEERAAMWEAIDTTVHPALPSLVEAMRFATEKEYAGARQALEAASQHLSVETDAALQLIVVINDAKYLASEKGASAGLQRLAPEEHRFDAAIPQLRMAARWRLGVLNRSTGHLAEAFRDLSEAYAIATSEGWEYDVALLALEIGSVYLETGDPVKAIALYEESYDVFSRMDETNYTEIILINLALAHGRVGDKATAERLTEDAVRRYRSRAEFDKYVSGLLNLAAMKKNLGKIDEAKAIYDEVLERTEANPLRMERIRALIGTASVFNYHGDQVDALTFLERARTISVELGQEVTTLDIDAKRADVLRELGNKDESLDLLRATFAKFCTYTYTHFTIQNGEMLERWLIEDGYPAEAYDVLKICTDLQREVYKKESERALQLGTVRQNMEAERKNLRLREEERRALLQQVLPLPIADRIMAGERRIAEQIDMVGILFADIVGFTQSSAGKTPSEVLEMLEDLFQAIDEVVASQGCEKIKSIGDSYMATSATSAGHTSVDPAQSIIRLARCGLDMLDLLQTSRHAHVQLRIGMHAGPVVAGVMDGMRLAYDMWGDTVNVASRMESTSAPGRFQTTAAVADLLRSLPEFKITPRDTIIVKGRGEMATYWVERGE